MEKKILTLVYIKSLLAMYYLNLLLLSSLLIRGLFFTDDFTCVFCALFVERSWYYFCFYVHIFLAMHFVRWQAPYILFLLTLRRLNFWESRG